MPVGTTFRIRLPVEVAGNVGAGTEAHDPAPENQLAALVGGADVGVEPAIRAGDA